MGTNRCAQELAQELTYNSSRQVFKPKIFGSKGNNFYTVYCLSKIMAYLALMLHYFLSICFEINIFNKVLFLYVVAEHIEKSCNILLFINDYFRDLPFVVLSLLRLGDVEINPGPKKLSVIKFYH